MTDRSEPAYGAQPPADSQLQIGDRADKACVQAALAVALRGPMTFELMQQAVDAYLAVAMRRGWTLS